MKTATPLPTGNALTALSQRVFARTTREGDCIVWTGKPSTFGYGRIRVPGTPSMTHVHRVTYTAARGPIGSGLVIDHLCRNRMCVNPDHLRAVDNATNILAGVGVSARSVALTHCKHGHRLDAANTVMYGPGGRWRRCRVCKARDAATSRRRSALA